MADVKTEKLSKYLVPFPTRRPTVRNDAKASNQPPAWWTEDGNDYSKMKACRTIFIFNHCAQRLSVATTSMTKLLLLFSPLLVSPFQPGFLASKPRISVVRAMTKLRASHTFLPSEEEENVSRWEKMYFGEEGFADGHTEEVATTISEVRVVTFDLDNTIWATSATIDAANAALFDHLTRNNISQPRRVEKVMGEIFEQDRHKYSPMEENETPKSPVFLTKLRVDAIGHILQSYNGYSVEDAERVASEAFQVWTNARHNAIPKNFAGNVIPCLQKIAKIKTSTGHPVLIGAITDGNSDPRNVECLKDFFDFCVNAESVGVAKPDKRVYLEAIRCVVSYPSFQNMGPVPQDNEEELENFVAPFWVHIGDDFSKDIVAAKLLKMRTIWATELIKEKLKVPQDNKDNDNVKVESFLKKVAEKSGPIEMPIGADNYLADALTEEFVDEVAEEFENISEILLSWHRNGDPIDQTTKVSSTQRVELPVDSTTLYKDEITILDDDDLIVATVPSRTFRLVRDDCTMDVPAPFKNRETQMMKDVMLMAQLDKSSGVFSFPPDDMKALQEGKQVLMIGVGDGSIQFSREILVTMTVQEILALSDENPLELSLFTKDAVDSPSIDLF